VSEELGAVVAAVEYRRAPEHPFPAPLDDCYRALEWLASQDDVDERRLAIGGASAGGALAASLALLARDRAEIRPQLQMLSYPMLDDRTSAQPAIDRYVRLWSGTANRFGWTSYLGHEPATAGTRPLAAPGRQPDLSGLPAAWIGLCTLDILHQEGLDYANRLRDYGVTVELEVAHGAFHGFDSIATSAPITEQYRRSQLTALRRAYTPTS
jgi:acetyl esterase/lipase